MPQQTSPKPPVLVVEDDPAIAELLTMVLRDMGLEARATASAAEGARWAGEQGFALAILDIHVQKGTGIDVARALRARSVSTPIVFASGSWTPEQRQATAAIPGSILFEKPYDLTRLQDTIRRLLGG